MIGTGLNVQVLSSGTPESARRSRRVPLPDPGEVPDSELDGGGTSRSAMEEELP